jgi:hypothetical protein
METTEQRPEQAVFPDGLVARIVTRGDRLAHSCSSHGVVLSSCTLSHF